MKYSFEFRLDIESKLSGREAAGASFFAKPFSGWMLGCGRRG